jgi:hypothetical protein
MQTPNQTIQQALAFLDDASRDVTDYPAKLREWMRPATRSHLRRLFSVTDAEADHIIDQWLARQTIS